MKIVKLSVAFILLIVSVNIQGQDNRRRIPDMADVKYGPHERNVLDMWFADSEEVTPLAIYIHGGGFVSGKKEGLNATVIDELLKTGISVAAINYRFLADAPLPAAHQDAQRALQFIRSKAEEWNIDRTKIAAFGGSAGAQLCMWLAFSDEMAMPDANNPVQRESSRLRCIATTGGQTSMNLDVWREWVPGFEDYRTTREQFYGELSEAGYAEIIKQISVINLVSNDDPSIFMKYGMGPDDPIPTNPKKAQSWKVHHVVFGIKLKEKMDALGVEADLVYPGSESKYKSRLAFLKAKLLQ